MKKEYEKFEDIYSFKVIERTSEFKSIVKYSDNKKTVSRLNRTTHSKYSDFLNISRKISKDLAQTDEKLESLTLILSQLEEGREGGSVVGVADLHDFIKHDITVLNKDIEKLEQYVRKQSAYNKHTKLHSQAIVLTLQSRLVSTSSEFKNLLQTKKHLLTKATSPDSKDNHRNHKNNGNNVEIPQERIQNQPYKQQYNQQNNQHHQQQFIDYRQQHQQQSLENGTLKKNGYHSNNYNNQHNNQYNNQHNNQYNNQYNNNYNNETFQSNKCQSNNYNGNSNFDTRKDHNSVYPPNDPTNNNTTNHNDNNSHDFSMTHASNLGANPGFSPVQQQLLRQRRAGDEAVRAEDQVGAIEQTIVELGGIFQQLATMVHEQADVVCRIDSHVDESSLNVEAAHSELLKYMRAVSRTRAFMLKLFVVLILLFLLCSYFLR